MRELGKPSDDDKFVFTTNAGWQLDEEAKKTEARDGEAQTKARRSIRTQGESSRTLYYGVIETMLLKSNLMLSSTGKRRSAYCFRHIYATFRLNEGVDVYFLSKQMGTSVKMIEDHYGHINPTKNADRILQGMPG